MERAYERARLSEVLNDMTARVMDFAESKTGVNHKRMSPIHETFDASDERSQRV